MKTIYNNNGIKIQQYEHCLKIFNETIQNVIVSAGSSKVEVCAKSQRIIYPFFEQSLFDDLCEHDIATTPIDIAAWNYKPILGSYAHYDVSSNGSPSIGATFHVYDNGSTVFYLSYGKEHYEKPHWYADEETALRALLDILSMNGQIKTAIASPRHKLSSK